MPIHPQDPSLISFPSVSSYKNENYKNRYKQKIQKLQEENSKLQKSLEEKDQEVTSLNNRVTKLTKSVDSLTLECSSISTAKVVEISKKNRHLTAELNCLKTKCKNLEESQQDLEKLLQEKEDQLNQQPPEEAPPPSSSEVQTISEKLEKAKRKVFEVLNQNTQLKNELKMAQKCLQQEIGENVSVPQLLAANTNWRGRAQQISMLNSKIAELKEKLETSMFGYCDEGERLPLKRLESMRKMEVETVHKELDECKEQLEDVKQKVIALKTRNKNLSDDTNNYKLKTLDLLEKTGRDEEFIKCLNEQIAMLKFEFSHKVEDMKKEVDQAYEAKGDAEVENEKLQCHLSNQERTLREKDEEIASLKEAIGELEQSVREMSGDFLFSCRQMNKDEYIKLLKNLEEEKNNLLSFMQQLNGRLDKESMKVSEQQEMIQKQRSKISRLEAKLRDIDNEREAVKAKNRRTVRINDYSRSLSNSSISSVRPTTLSKDKISPEVDKYKFKLEVALERITFLEMKIKDQNEIRHEDNQKFVEIISKSKEIFKNLFDSKETGGGDKLSSCPDSIDTTINSTFTEI